MSTPPASTEVTRTLARFVVDSQVSDLPAAVRHEASRGLLNWLGCALGGANHPSVEAALQALGPFFGPAQARIVGRPERADVLHAALINGISSHVLDFDDTHARAIHPSAPVLPAVLAYAQWKGLRGIDLVHAYVLGVEVEERVGLSVFPEHYDRGWHITGTAGVFGAAAAVGKLLGLDEQRMCWALGLAATQSSGLREMFGSMAKSFHPGRAAQNGLGAALLAQRGFTSSDRAIEAPRGFGHVLSTKFDPSVITSGLGERYELMQNMYKPYACGLVVHAVIDATLQLRREHGLRGPEIRSITATVTPLVLELTAKRKPQDGLEGKFSVFHAIAVSIVHGAAGEPQFSTAVVRDPEVVALRDRVDAVVDPTLHKLEGKVRIELLDGRVLERHVLRALGSLEHPMADADLEAKFRSLADGVLPPAQADALIAGCWGIAGLDNVATLAELTAPGAL
ncbi:MAG: MmgE/PrpD family protein [Pseudomonadota bacterium]